MPNWCENRLEITFDTYIEYISFVQKVFTDSEGEIRPQQDDFPFLERLLPTPPEKLEISDFSEDGWYEWRTHNWGCKWDIASPFFNLDDESLIISMSFDTPWGPPVLGINAISQQYPSADFRLMYYEMGMCFAGTYKVRDGIFDDMFMNYIPRELYADLGVAFDDEGHVDWENSNDDFDIFSVLEEDKKLQKYLKVEENA